MNDTPKTRPSLLLRVRDVSDHDAWTQFVEVYTPVIYRYCRGRGLQDGDAADVAQEAMRAVARSIPSFEYDPVRGRFRNWLLTIVQNKLNNFFAHQQRQPIPLDQETIELKLEKNPPTADDPAWEADYQRGIFNWAAQRVRGEFKESTWLAFWRTTMEGCDGKTVAESLGLSIGAVYVAKSRVIARLKEEIQNVDLDEAVPPECSP